MILAADSSVFPAFLALAGVIVMAAVQWRSSRDKQRLAERTAEASNSAVVATQKADLVRAQFEGWDRMVDVLSKQNLSQQTQLDQKVTESQLLQAQMNEVRAKADRCEAERAQLLVRLTALEQK